MEPKELPAWAFQNPTNIVHAPRWLKAAARAQHFSPTQYAARGTGDNVEAWAWNSRRAEHYDANDANDAEQYLR